MKRFVAFVVCSCLLLGTVVFLASCKPESNAPAAVKEIAIASGADPISLDPRKTWVGPGYSINAHVFEPLVFRKEEAGKLSIVGVLAERWENVDETTWKFYLKKNVTFHNGKPLTAEAVEFTIETIMQSDFVTSLKTWTADIASVEVESDLVAVIKTKYPTPGLLNCLCQMPIVEPSAVKELGVDFNIKPVGTGPYKIKSYIPNNQVVVEKFAGYWGTPGNYEKITFRIIPNNSVRLAALQSGEVVLAEAVPPDKLDVIEKDPNFELASSRTMRLAYLSLEHSNKWLAKKEVRQAISLAIDRQLLVNTILGGRTIPANSVAAPGTVGYHEALPVYPHDAARAKALLREAGYDGSVLKMGGCVGRYNMDKQICEAAAGMLREIGMNIELEVVDWSTFRPKTQQNAYDIWYIASTDFTLNPNAFWRGEFDSATSELGYSNPEVDRLMQASAQEMEPEVRAGMLREVQELLYEDMATVPMYYEPQLIGVSKKLKGFSPRLDEYVIVGYTTMTP